MMYAPFLTRTHRDAFGVYSWMRQISGISLFGIWSFDDGIANNLTESSEGPDEDSINLGGVNRTWGDAEWRKFFGMPSSRLMLIMPGDTAFIKAGAFHRVFTLETKVVAYDNYLDGITFTESIRSHDATYYVTDCSWDPTHYSLSFRVICVICADIFCPSKLC
jgi:hypothetical protein